MDQDVIHLFHELVDCSPAEREAYYAARLVPAAVRVEVESLLRFDATSAHSLGGYVASAAEEVLADVQYSPQMPSLRPGSHLGSYEILTAIGAGGMGQIYKAHDPRLKRDIALKVLPAEMIPVTERRQRFEREAQAIAALNHPNIVTIYSVEEAEGLPFLTMEFIDGKPLLDLLPPAGLPLDTLLALSIPLADAIGAAHQRGITHRDLKPANIMVTSDGRVKVLDFGLAKLREPHASDLSTLPTKGLTGSGRIIGTVAYMSPEQAEGKVVDERSDIFSLGIVLYEMATGQRPFKGDTAVSTISAIVKDTPAPVTDLKRTLPRDLARIIRRALAKDPERRYQTAKDVRNDLEELKQAVVSGELIASAPAHESGAWTKRTFAILSAGSAVALIVLLLALWSAQRAGNGLARLQSQPLEFTVTQLTSEPGTEKEPSLSPDGKWVLYRSGPPGKGDIYLQSVGGRTPINLTKDSPADDGQPAFSPDGERIVFRSEREGGGLFLMGRTGESVTRLTETGYNPAWSPDGTEVVYAESPADDPYFRGGLSHLWIVKVVTGEKRQLAQMDGVQPSWSPHGLRIAYWAVGGSNRIRDIFTIPAAGGQPAAVTNDAAVDANPIWAPDGRHLYFVSDRSGSMNLWRVAIDESSGRVLSAPEPVTTPSPFVLNLSVSTDGKRLAFTSILSTQNIHKLAFDPRAGRTIGAPVPVTTGTRRWQTFNPSPDGQWVAMDSGPPQEDIYVIHADGSGLRQLTNDAAFDRRPFWSPDGSRIAFHSNRGGVQQIWSVKPDGSELRRLSDYPGSGLLSGTWSPDASRIAAFVQTVNRAVLFDPRKAWQDQTPEELPPLEGGGAPIGWSADGLRLTCQTDSATFVYSFKSKSYQRLTEYPASVAWLGDNRRLILESRDGRLLLMDSLSKQTSELFSILPEVSSWPRLSRDNRQIFFMRGDDQADIYMLNIK